MKKTSNNNFGANSEDTVDVASEKDKSNTSEEPLKNVQTLNGTLPTTLSFVDETSPSNALIPHKSPVSEPANSVTTDHETPASTARNNISALSAVRVQWLIKGLSRRTILQINNTVDNICTQVR